MLTKLSKCFDSLPNVAQTNTKYIVERVPYSKAEQ